ncbi:hypothetical protein [Arenibacter troitsensis]|uniref:Uncharacterized protein n=1 Tax=Arenibacter troitsensis TaxID=188872 RepID=A0A1X7J7J3_9FLAO|nr:hypothetical protein [Arenibacter troitsensis]SMG23480.1 hypothetical protein SAMN03080602_01449 [Arenibacter troitsensis]
MSDKNKLSLDELKLKSIEQIDFKRLLDDILEGFDEEKTDQMLKDEKEAILSVKDTECPNCQAKIISVFVGSKCNSALPYTKELWDALNKFTH